MGILSGLVGVGASIFGGGSSKKASRAAQQAQIDALNKAITAQNVGYGRAVDAFSPYSTAGAGAQGQINALLGIQSPGQVDWAAYVNGNPDALANWAQVKGSASDTFGGDIAQFGQYHYMKDGARRDLAPFTVGATDANSQQAAINELMASPYYQSLYNNGEEAILQNSAATGGLRGGNIQRSLANFGRDSLSQAIQQQLSNLTGVANQGLNAATGVANAATGNATNVANLQTSIGDTRAGGILQRSAINSNMINQVSQGIGSILNTTPLSIFGGGGGQNTLGSQAGQIF